jgi:CheY-like chemotaxis protein
MEHSVKIIVADVKAIIATFISSVLKSHGYFVTVIRKGKDALERIQTSYYNLVLLDIGLPDTTGTEILMKIRETNRDIIVIMITGHSLLDS